MDKLFVNANPELVKSITVEVTNLCNLKCRYCWSRASKLNESRVLSTEIINKIIKFCHTYQIQHVDLTGGGELTMAPKWREVCQNFLDHNIKLNVTTNLAKHLTDKEIRVLSLFTGLCVSLDSVDKTSLANTRIGSDIAQILHNLIRIKACAAKMGTPQPNIGFTAVLSAQTATHFHDLAATVIALDAERFQVIDLVVDARLEDNLSPVWDLRSDDANTARESIQSGLALVRNSKTRLIVQPEIEQRLSHLGEEQSQLHLIGIDDSHRKTFMRQPSSGETRNCLDPWQLLQIYADGRVVTCCFGSFVIGNLYDNSLEEILVGEDAKELRQQLVTGELNVKCSMCTFRPLMPVSKYQEKVSDLINNIENFEAKAITSEDD